MSVVYESVSRGGRACAGFGLAGSSGVGACPVIRPEGIYLNGHRVIRLGMGVGALERQDPLPVGRYWIDVQSASDGAFQSWASSHSATVKIRETKAQTSGWLSPTIDATTYMFDVTAPTPWVPVGQGIGFPTIAASPTMTIDQTAQRPPPEQDPLDKLSDYGANVAQTGKTILWVVGGVTAMIIGGVLILRYTQRPAAAAPSPAT